jgi:hypothetical protein
MSFKYALSTSLPVTIFFASSRFCAPETAVSS